MDLVLTINFADQNSDEMSQGRAAQQKWAMQGQVFNTHLNNAPLSNNCDSS